MKWTANHIPDQTGKLAIVTGANSGIGLETARGLAGAGAQVILAVRDFKKGNEARRNLLETAPGATIMVEYLDLACLESVAEFAERMTDCYSAIDLLVNNAGVMAPPTRHTTPDGFELQLQTNYLGHFALTGHLLPLLMRGRSRRVVNVSSLAHRPAAIDFSDLQGESYDPWRAYGQSKLAVLMFSLELNRRSRAYGWDILSNAAHPGLARTNLQVKGPSLDGPRTKRGVWIAKVPWIWQSAAQGALPVLYAATNYSAVGGGYYGPGGFWEIKGAPAPARIARHAIDEQLRERLWALSEQLTRVHYEAVRAR